MLQLLGRYDGHMGGHAALPVRDSAQEVTLRELRIKKDNLYNNEKDLMSFPFL